ncbi:MAG: hypothetical protein NWE83_03775 [Candidatus Bathyarchaeota archaeon]|nr:hypothetical protein [Candidatus Bathyarchaeota archaeon]
MNWRVILVVGVLTTIFGVYTLMTYPITAISFPVSFTIGADTKHEALEISVLQSQVRTDVVVAMGSTWWTAKIFQDDTEVWSHSMTQNDQTVFQSDWIELQPGSYDFTYTAASLAALDLDVTVITKGDFW